MIGLCRHFRCLPSALMEEDASLLRLLAIEQRGRPPEQQDPQMDGGEWA